ncbi:site-specific recombinase XerD [Galbibacter orientalis DSM 19592]|uniref:Site-specific recombinase XerD n=1 Tax=Galbibacter orientalis DSM 19592 TaxID=926559 RepID=I3CAY3_9FLAO|nr:site-specific integrase [Galbibacter orientalis]EIJ40776.1 site-specific recombinase XerD [Galbibacter orientalis DSM 19592]
MSSIKVLLWKKNKNKLLHPLAIRITKDRRTSYFSIGQYIEEKYWDSHNRKVKKSHPNADKINQLILVKLAEINGCMLDSEALNSHASVATIKRKLTVANTMDFFSVADEYLQSLIDREKYNQYISQKGRIKKLQLFVGNSKLNFKEITVPFLKKYETFLLHGQKKSPRTVVNHLIVIRTIYNRAIADEIVSRDFYPFGKGKIQLKFPQSEKIGLSIEEVKKLEAADFLAPAQKHAVNLWLFSFYFAGIRIGDLLLLKWSDFKDGRLYYRMSKNKKYDSLKIPEKAYAILEYYKNEMGVNKRALVFPDIGEVNLNDKKHIAVRVKTITRNLNRRLKLAAETLKINKNISMHIARHTFGNISGDKIPIQMLQKLYRHSSVTTTINYQANFMKKEADMALDKVVNF